MLLANRELLSSALISYQTIDKFGLLDLVPTRSETAPPSRTSITALRG